jgi:hypothetical protein
MSVCPVCESPSVEIRGKAVCPFCHIIIETCCDGGRCDYSKPQPKPLDNKTEDKP